VQLAIAYVFDLYITAPPPPPPAAYVSGRNVSAFFSSVCIRSVQTERNRNI
jgi:hypothetical protein